MHIIKHGNLEPRYFVCRYCGCEFVADKSEYKVAASGDNFFVDCPECYACFDQHAPLWKDV